MNSDKPTITVPPAPSLREWTMWIIRRRIRLRVSGESMSPTLSSGDIVLVNPSAYDNSPPEVNEIILARHPYIRDLSIIKRIAEITQEGRLVLHSDNPTVGSDSRSFGTISPNQVIGKITSRSPLTH